jgi:hypothetical protein
LRFSGYIVAASMATWIINFNLGFEVAQPFVFIVDGVLLAVVIHTAIRSSAYWPIWFCGFQAISVATGLASFVSPGRLPLLYTNFAGFWAIPALIAVVIGITLDRRAQLAN